MSTCRHILQQKDSAFEMRSAKEQDIISNLKHCINAMTSYQFRVIVGLSISSHFIILLYQIQIVSMPWHGMFLRHCINFGTLYLFWDLVFISRLGIYFGILYSYRDIDPRHHIHFKKAHISRFSVANSIYSRTFLYGTQE